MVSRALVLGAALALGGCGSNSAAPAKPVAAVELGSSSFSGLIPARYTCDGKNVSPALEWSALPAETASLVLLVIGATPEPSTSTEKLSIEWAVANLSPQLHKLTAGRLPHGAEVGVDSTGKSGYSICPKRGEHTQYHFELYGLPAGAVVPPHFAGVSVFKALTATKSPATAHGSFAANYERG